MLNKWSVIRTGAKSGETKAAFILRCTIYKVIRPLSFCGTYPFFRINDIAGNLAEKFLQGVGAAGIEKSAPVAVGSIAKPDPTLLGISNSKPSALW